MRIPLMAGNWKMYKTPAETTAFFEKLVPLVAGSKHCEILICPPFVNIAAAVAATAGTAVGVGGQNLHWAKEGAYTGEVAAPMLKAAGCRSAIIGHSERRQYFGETDETVLKKTVAALDAGLQPVVCVGEMLEEREAGRTNDVLRTQFTGGLAPLTAEQFAQVVIAYEPVWAIGTGKTATPEIAAEAHQFLRQCVRAKFGDEAASGADTIRRQCQAGQREGLMAKPDIDGGLVGGASLDAVSFASIVNF